jgi:hypothetical protein
MHSSVRTIPMRNASQPRGLALNSFLQDLWIPLHYSCHVSAQTLRGHYRARRCSCLCLSILDQGPTNLGKGRGSSWREKRLVLNRDQTDGHRRAEISLLGPRSRNRPLRLLRSRTDTLESGLTTRRSARAGAREMQLRPEVPYASHELDLLRQSRRIWTTGRQWSSAHLSCSNTARSSGVRPL